MPGLDERQGTGSHPSPLATDGVTDLAVGALGDDDGGSGCGAVWILFLDGPDPCTLLENLIEDVVVLNLNRGIENSLDAKLDAVLNALDDVNHNNDQAAINVLEAFINAVAAQSGSHISVAESDDLIASAQAIIDLLTAP